MRHFLKHAFLLGIVLTIGFLTGCTSLRQASTTATDVAPTSGGKPQAPIIVTVDLEGQNPHPKGDLYLRLSITPLIDAPNTSVTITLPSNISLTSGALTWKGNLRTNETRTLRVRININRLPEVAAIKAEAVSTQEGLQFGKVDLLYLRELDDGTIEASKPGAVVPTVVSPIPTPVNTPVYPTREATKQPALP